MTVFTQLCIFLLDSHNLMTCVTAMKLKIKRDTLNKMFCTVYIFHVKRANL